MIGNEKQKTRQKNTIFKSKMLKGLCPCYFYTCYFHILKKLHRDYTNVKSFPTNPLSLTGLPNIDTIKATSGR